MRLYTAQILLLTACVGISTVSAFGPSSVPSKNEAIIGRRPASALSVSATVDETEAPPATVTFDDVRSMTFRQLQRSCVDKGLPAVGNTATLRSRILEAYGLATVPAASNASAASDEATPDGIQFFDEADPDFEYNSLLKEVNEKAAIGHWKVATRRLKKLNKRYASPERPVPEETFVAVLEACAADRLHGARASEPARKIMEEMVERGMEIPPSLGNGCVSASIGKGPNGTHDDCGGIDCALAMMAAMDASVAGTEMITVDSYAKVVSALANDGAVEEAILLLNTMVAERFFTPNLSTFADVAMAAAKDGKQSESVLRVLTLAKAAGYELDNIASVDSGRSLLASGLIASEQMDNVALGLRLLTAAAKAEGCAPDRGDDLVCSSSSAAQRAATLTHRRGVEKAVTDGKWQLAVKLLELMTERSLKPATSVWRKVVTCCAKAAKSRKATALLLDWVALSKDGKADKPPLAVFNTVVNACEICGEEDLTVRVLDTMKETHDTEGNIITTNIAMKRLAKLGSSVGCEGIIIGMLQSGMEPNVVSYTTAIGACAKEGMKNPALAYEWIKRMRSRNVEPNYHTYNTALAACIDGKLESTIIGSKIAAEMLADVTTELKEGIKGEADMVSRLPDSYSKVLSRKLMKQLRDNWRNDDINMAVAKSTVRVPLLKLVDFDKSEAGLKIKEQEEERKKIRIQECGEDDGETESAECEIEYEAVKNLHTVGRRMIEV